MRSLLTFKASRTEKDEKTGDGFEQISRDGRRAMAVGAVVRMPA